MIWDKVQLTPDNDPNHYTTQECKKCNRQFKVTFGQGNKPVAYCPYCGWHEGQFWTTEQMIYLDCMARNKIKKPNGICKEPVEDGPNNIRPPTQCQGSGKHSEKIKHDGGNPAPQFCIICGNGI